MSLSLSYNNDLARVQVALSGLPAGTVHVERSVNGLYWETVRGGSALPVTGGAAALDDYEFAADVENFYRATPSDPWVLDDIVGAAGYAETASDPSVAPSVDAPAAGLLVCAWTTWDYNASPYELPASMTETVQQIGESFSVCAVATEAVPAGATGTRSAALGTDDRWSAVSVAIPGSSVAIEDAQWGYFNEDDWVSEGDGPSVTTAAAEAGWWMIAITGADSDSGDFLGAPPGEGWELIAGTPSGSDSRTMAWAREVTTAGAQDVAIEVAASDTFLTVLLVSGVGDAVESDSITPSLGGKAWLKSIRHPFLNRPIHRVLAGGGQSIGRASRGSLHEVQGRSVPVAVTDIRSSREFTLTIQVPDEAAARDMDLTLASGDVFFIQVPPDLGPHMAGGYVTIGDTAQHRESDTIMWRFTIPCKVVAPPGPGVVGTTMTWGGVFRLYGSWGALVASNPTWGDLLSTVGSPEDLVVL